MFGSLSSDGFKIKILVGGNLHTQEKFKMTTRSQNTCCIGRHADKSGLHPSVRNQNEVEKYVTSMTYSNFFQKLRIAVDNIALCKTKRVRANTQKWFDGEVLENINPRDKLFKRFKKSRLHIDKELYKKSKYNTVKLITAKKRAFFDEKLTECIGKPKEL